MARFEVITGPERQCRWSADQKRAIVAESFAPRAVASTVALRIERLAAIDLRDAHVADQHGLLRKRANM
jgi:transposase-like protein